MRLPSACVKLSLLTGVLALSAGQSNPAVTSEALQDLITLEDLLAGSQKLQDFADANGGTRVFGSAGHNQTVDYLFDTLNALDYYDVFKQPFVELFFEGNATLAADGVDYSPGVMSYSPSGTVSAPLVLVSNLGCDVTDFPAGVSGNIALISRGNCTFAIKTTNAKAAGAVAAVVYNNIDAASLTGTLGGPSDNFVPVVGITLAQGDDLISALAEGEMVADLIAQSTIENRTNFNVIAETKTGDKDNVLMLGGHTDSVAAGPGINDDGSGTIGSLTVAVALSKFAIKNAVRFGFWGAEEYGKLGSYYYMKQLNTSEAEVAKIRAYLNFDMIASPNYMNGIYDGDGSAFNVSGPPGSADLEKTFQEFFRSKNTTSVAAEFSGRSDYAAFIENGIPAGGIFTGAEGIKTAEQAFLFGGEAGVAYDVNYHQAGDTIDNLAQDAYLLNTKGIADAVAKYATSFDSLPAVDPAQRRKAAAKTKMFSKAATGHSHSHSGPCGHDLDVV
ncbi:Leucyl aminopeptidase yscIV [Neopestalotiopsis sp. 37M]|nr:Leucyl aminopeptidase yscIV [Neopestalotiopsis sp. 37M]